MPTPSLRTRHACLALAVCLAIANPRALAQPAVGESASKHLSKAAERYAVYQVDAQMTTEEPFEGTSTTEDRHYVRPKPGAPYDLLWYTDDNARVAHGDTITRVIGAERDSARYMVLTGRQRKWFFEPAFGSEYLPEHVLTWDKWKRAAAPAGLPPGATFYTRDFTRKDQRWESELTLADDGFTVLSVESRNYLLDELSSRRRADYRNYRFDDGDAVAAQIASFPRARLVRMQSTPAPATDGSPAAPTLAIVKGQPMPVLAGTNLAGDSIVGPRTSSIYFFSFIGCTPCAAALECFRKNDFAMKDGARLVYVNSVDAPDKVAYYVKSKFGDPSFDILLLSSAQTNELGITAYPRIVVVDAGGTVTDEAYGTMPWHFSQLVE